MVCSTKEFGRVCQEKGTAWTILSWKIFSGCLNQNYYICGNLVQ